MRLYRFVIHAQREYKYWRQELSEESWSVVEPGWREMVEYWKSEVVIRKQRIAKAMGYAVI